ncbi:class I mannose-6-phosphate isomerase [Eubacteriales bacterium OttesenSCG-928-N13]|nr:class I mannose-6-phosphate isomerase [Eubacteriales bacterium OttesenSCG-928-N13]
MNPHYRHGNQTPWGGSELRDLYQRRIPDDRTGESLEVSALPGMASTVMNGALSGMSLIDAIAQWGDGLTGPMKGAFPLLLKLIDAREQLSLQVHPGDDYAGAHENGKLGKTEAWVLLNAPKDARLVYGVNATREQLAKAVADGQLESALRYVPVQAGDVLYIPHGMVHALGDGIQIYEIQQSSDVTYRFWDWGRVGLDGQPRQLHMEQALDVTDPDLRLDKLQGVQLPTEGGEMTIYIADAHFALWRLAVDGTMPLPSGQMLFVTPLTPCELCWGDGQRMQLGMMQTVLIPAALKEVSLVGQADVLMSGTPDQDALRNQLGARASEVAGLTDEQK